ncbi:MAG TPA: DEAD/DEAH box helicase [Thermoplasmatales archaeon]|nr:DEAD/DEAH box helicase [Thermoplasmatales archaeon]
MREDLLFLYQNLIKEEYEKLECSNFDFKDSSSFLRKEDILRICGDRKDVMEELQKRGLLVPFQEDRFRTTHFDLMFRLVYIRNLEHQRPIPLEHRIVMREELVPDFGTYKFTTILPEILPEDSEKEITIEAVSQSLSKRYTGLSSYQYPIIKELLLGEAENLAIVAPTASGKTITFFLPVLIQAISRKLKAVPGTSSILVYPRKALERDQLQNFLRFVDAANAVLQRNGIEAITIAIDDGDTPEAEIQNGDTFRKLKCVECEDELVVSFKDGTPLVSCITCQKEYPYLLPTKKEIRQNNPSILITNIHTIYRRLIAPDTVGIFEGLDYVIFDEAHVYTNYFGGHVSYITKLLRYVANQNKRYFLLPHSQTRGSLSVPLLELILRIYSILTIKGR